VVDFWLLRDWLWFSGWILAGFERRKRGFFVAKTWTKRGCSVVVVVLSLVVFGTSYGWAGGRRFNSLSRNSSDGKQADLWHSFRVADQQPEFSVRR
jgi:hypothetical protein